MLSRSNIFNSVMSVGSQWCRSISFPDKEEKESIVDYMAHNGKVIFHTVNECDAQLNYELFYNCIDTMKQGKDHLFNPFLKKYFLDDPSIGRGATCANADIIDYIYISASVPEEKKSAFRNFSKEDGITPFKHWNGPTRQGLDYAISLMLPYARLTGSKWYETCDYVSKDNKKVRTLSWDRSDFLEFYKNKGRVEYFDGVKKYILKRGKFEYAITLFMQSYPRLDLWTAPGSLASSCIFQVALFDEVMFHEDTLTLYKNLPKMRCPKYLKKSQAENNKKKDEGCFITTAVCKSFDKTEDCYELTQFRNFRDKWLIKQNNGDKIIQEYYAIAPNIVKKIDMLPNSSEIYKRIWVKYLSECLKDIEKDNMLSCKEKYIEMVNDLKRSYLV